MIYVIQPTYKILRERSNAVCEVCGGAYWVQATRLDKSRYCSQACKAAGRAGAFSKEELARLYYGEKLSMLQIARHFRCSPNKVAYWMQQYGLERRDWSDAGYAHHNPDGDPFAIRMPETVEESMRFGVGIGLYMGEGDKLDHTNVSLSNSNAAILKIFVEFLEDFCGVDRSALRAVLHIYPDLDSELTLQWWAEQLGLDRSQFTKPSLLKGKIGTYKTKSKYGTLNVRFSNTKLKEIILTWCAEQYDRRC